jgi:hypothetical protein
MIDELINLYSDLSFFKKINRYLAMFSNGVLKCF